MKHNIKVIYAEDNAFFRNEISKELDAFHISVVAQCGNGKELMDQLNLWPDVVLLDLEMPVMNGNDVFDHIVKNVPDAKIIIVSMHYEELLIEDYIKRGARGYITKDAFAGNIELLVEGITKVSEGETFIHKMIAQPKKFSERQKEIIPLILEGYTSKEIASEVGIEPRSVEKQKQKIYSKFGANKAIDFYRYAFSKGLQFLKKLK